MANAPQATDSGSACAKVDADNENEIEQLQKAIEQLQQLKAHLQKDKYANLTLDILSTIVDDLCVDVCVDVHRSLKMDLLYVPRGDTNPSNRVVDMPGYDIHGQVPQSREHLFRNVCKAIICCLSFAGPGKNPQERALQLRPLRDQGRRLEVRCSSRQVHGPRRTATARAGCWR